MHIILIFVVALVALSLMPGWKSYAAALVAIVVFLVVIFMDEPSTGNCSGPAECGGAMAGYLLKGPIMTAFWGLFLLVALLKAWRLSVVLQPRR